VLLPAIVAPCPFTVIAARTNGSPLPPSVALFVAINEYVQLLARLI
jgi:hypothetical protein